MCFRALYLVAGASRATSQNHPTASRQKHLQIGQIPGSSNKVSLRIGLPVKGKLWRVREDKDEDENSVKGREALSSCWSSEYKYQFL
jgi:hypothetical protein